MTNYEVLLDEALEEDVNVIDNYQFNSYKIKGLYCNNTIAINQKIDTEKEKICILAEELGHHFTSHGDIINTKNISDCKQERKARIWAYNKLIGLQGLVKCCENNCKNKFEMANFLGVTENFLNEAIAYYKEHYGLFAILDTYIINFEPNLFITTKSELGNMNDWK
jgi:hypothetical protein